MIPPPRKPAIPPRKQQDLFGSTIAPQPPKPTPPKHVVVVGHDAGPVTKLQCDQCQGRNFNARYAGSDEQYHTFMCYSGAKVLVANLPSVPTLQPGDVALFRLGVMGIEFSHLLKKI